MTTPEYKPPTDSPRPDAVLGDGDSVTVSITLTDEDDPQWEATCLFVDDRYVEGVEPVVEAGMLPTLSDQLRLWRLDGRQIAHIDLHLFINPDPR